jgi:hypothetical protein
VQEIAIVINGIETTVLVDGDPTPEPAPAPAPVAAEKTLVPPNKARRPGANKSAP